MVHLTTSELEAGLDHVRASPADAGLVLLVVRRPALGERETLDVAELHPEHGLLGDTWSSRPSKRTPDGSPHPDMQLTLMNATAAALVAAHEDRWGLAGDQLYVDLDLSPENLPAGSRLRIGGAVVEVTAQPHTGCAKFVERFGEDAMRFVNGGIGRTLRLRGVNAKVVAAGQVRHGDRVVKLPFA